MNRILHTGYLLTVALLLGACAEQHGPTYMIARDFLTENHSDAQLVTVDGTSDTCLHSPESFRIKIDRDGRATVSATGEAGLLYGAFALRRLSRGGCDTAGLDTVENPVFPIRVLNHWDNLDGTIERGYSGRSLWKWGELPDTISPRLKEYATRCAEVGINGAVLNNVNASPAILSVEYLRKVKAIADYLRPYNIRVYLSANFASPMVLDSLPTADPLDMRVQEWWSRKADEIYALIPDFGGFLVKANSEGQPGPCDYGRTHADGANMMAGALKPHGGMVIWRAFVYSPSDPDRAKQAYNEFKPLDGRFAPNVIVQVKNGPVDFQPREPYSPLFGAMASTPLAVEFQITQEYLGHSNHLCYLAPMWSEFFRYVKPGQLAGVAGVANVGDNACMTGHPFGHANWYAFGRMAWNPALTPEDIAREWTGLHLFTGDSIPPAEVESQIIEMMLTSREAAVNFMMPLGLHHLFAFGHHYGPEPWCAVEGARPDWLPSYYHRADRQGIGFDRSASGSDCISQYPDSIALTWGDAGKCPDTLLLWFHHVPWTHTMHSGRTLWEELCHSYNTGVATVNEYGEMWESARPYVSPEVYSHVAAKLKVQADDARWWRDACLLYFSSLNGMPVTGETPRARHSLEEYKSIKLPIDNYQSPADSLLRVYR